MDKKARLSSAVHWLKKFEGKHFIRSYRKRYGVDDLCAMLELRELGHPVSDEQIRQARKTIENKTELRKREKNKKKEAEFNELYSDSDETFAFIAGYTPGGVPYGVTWEEMGEEPPDFDEFSDY